MQNNSFLSTIGGKPVMIPNELKDFTLTTKESSQVSFFGVNMKTDTIFVQFKSNGAGYLYPGQPVDALKAIMGADSVGSWVIQNLSRPKGKSPAEFEKADYAIELVTDAKMV